MTGTEAAAAYTAQFQPDAEAMRRHLPEVGDALAAQLIELHAHPSAAGAEQVAVNLAGASRALLRFAEALRKEVVA